MKFWNQNSFALARYPPKKSAIIPSLVITENLVECISHHVTDILKSASEMIIFFCDLFMYFTYINGEKPIHGLCSML